MSVGSVMLSCWVVRMRFPRDSLETVSPTAPNRAFVSLAPAWRQSTALSCVPCVGLLVELFLLPISDTYRIKLPVNQYRSTIYIFYPHPYTRYLSPTMSSEPESTLYIGASAVMTPWQRAAPKISLPPVSHTAASAFVFPGSAPRIAKPLLSPRATRYAKRLSPGRISGRYAEPSGCLSDQPA
jgi:hypothetical protein